jgi:hypothetical protein
MQITHSYLGTTTGRFRCMFFLLFEDYIEAQNGLSNDLKLEIERFARNMGDSGVVVAPFAGDVPTTQGNVRDKHWPHESVELLYETPAMLMIDKDFDEFDPRYHPWILFHFGRGEQDAAKFRSLLQKIAEAVTDGSKDPFKIVEKALQLEQLSSASKSIQLKPGVFGISIDLRSAWDALKSYLRSERSHGESA